MGKLFGRSSGDSRLVLGFDAGCTACSELAKNIEDAVGERLEVRSLHEPQVYRWREEALGEDAPWAPTLIEVRGEEVRAWTGIRMGVRLSRVLGPKDTWRVMQVLGEVRNESSIVGANSNTGVGTGLTRAQFLKGVGGAALAMSVLSGVSTTPASATTGNEIEIRRTIVRSPQYRKLVREHARLGISFGNPDHIEIHSDHSAGLATAGMAWYGKHGTVGTIFQVDLEKNEVYSYAEYISIPDGQSGEHDLTFREDGRVRERVKLAEEYVVSDGQRMTHEEYQRKLKSTREQSSIGILQTPSQCYSNCLGPRETYCNVAIAIAGGVAAAVYIGLLAVVTSTAYTIYLILSEGCASYARAACYQQCYG